MKILFGFLLLGGALGWGEKERVRLEDVEVVTLTRGAFTTGRRSSPVAQLACVGGSGRGEEQPEIVQCYSDGRAFQWECKADMENGLRFGQVEVVCEGFDYPDDPNILAGSCGLEYTLELTKEGREKRSSSGGGGGWGGDWSNPSYSYSSNSLSELFLILLVVVLLGIVIYAVYKTCEDSPSIEDRQNEAEADYNGGGAGRRGTASRGWGEGGVTASSGTRTASGFGGTKSR